MQDKSTTVISVVIVFFVLTYVSVGLRTFTRLRIKRSFGADDVAIIILLMIFTGYLGSQVMGWRHGLGKHESELSPEDRSRALMWWLICFLLYIVVVCLFKIAVVLFLMRVAVEKWHIWILQFIMCGVVVLGTAYVFMAAFQCKPTSVWWEQGPRTPGLCWNDKAVLGMDVTASIVNCFADWVLGILPIFMVRGLNMRQNTKILVTCLLSFAAVGSTATFVRMFFLGGLLSNDDFLFTAVEVAYLSTVECGVGITAVSIGTLKPLVEQWRGRLDTSVAASSNPSDHSWTIRRRENAKRLDYIRAGTPNSRFGSIFSTSKSADHSIVNTLSSTTEHEHDETVHQEDGGETKTGTTQSLNESKYTGKHVTISAPRPAVLPGQVFLDEPSSTEQGSPRIPRLAPLPSLFALFGKRRSKGYSKTDRSTVLQTQNSSNFEFQSFSRTRTSFDRPGSGSDVELSPV